MSGVSNSFMTWGKGGRTRRGKDERPLVWASLRPQPHFSLGRSLPQSCDWTHKLRLGAGPGGRVNDSGALAIGTDRWTFHDHVSLNAS